MTSAKRAVPGAILVVENEDSVRRFLIRVLDREGHDAHGTAFGREALKKPFAHDVFLAAVALALSGT